MKEVDSEEEARKRGFAKGSKFKLLQFDFVLPTETEAQAALAKRAKENVKDAGGERLSHL
jgi:hypothetical protein